MKKYLSVVVLIAIVVVLFAAAFVRIDTSTPQVPANGKLLVAASFYPLGFFASQIGGDKAEVTTITPAGAEPHDYEPTAKDIAAIQNSNILVLNGANLEAWGNDIRQTINSQHTIVVIAGEGIATKHMTENGTQVIDPHVWLSPQLAQEMVDKITAAFLQADPDNAHYYATNAAVLKTKLAALNATYRQGLAQCAQKDFITSHAAFGYLASTYGLNQIAIAGLSPDAEPSPKQLANISDYAKAHNIKYIFFESLVSPKLSQTIAQEVGAQTMVLDPIEGITSADLAAGQSYFTKMQENLHNLEVVLECKA